MWARWPLSLAVCLCCLILSPSILPITSAQSITFLADQPVNYTAVPVNSTSVSISVLYLFANSTLLVYSNATNTTATLPSGLVTPISQLPAFESASFLPYTATSILVLPLFEALFVSASAYSDMYVFCTRQVTGAVDGICNVTVTFTAPTLSTIAYSVYIIPNIPFATNSQYSTSDNILAPNDWDYFSLYITEDELDVLFTLTPTLLQGVSGASPVPDVDLWLAAVSTVTSPLVPIFPTNANGTYTYIHTGGQETVELNGDGGWQDGLYIIGVHAPATVHGTSGYTLILQSTVSDDTVTGSGVEVSMFAIVGALVVLVLCLFSAAAIIARRRRSYIRDLHTFDSSVAQAELMHRIQVRALADGRVIVTPVDVYQGATDSQIGRLPSHVYEEGEMSAEDAKCSICLDEFVASESTVKVLHCGHVYHDSCITTWLHTRKHCPLCLQNVDNAHDVARRAVDSKPVAASSGVPTVAKMSGSDDGVKIEVSAALRSTVVDSSTGSASSGRRSSSGQEDGQAIELAYTAQGGGQHEERKEQ